MNTTPGRQALLDALHTCLGQLHFDREQAEMEARYRRHELSLVRAQRESWRFVRRDLAQRVVVGRELLAELSMLAMRARLPSAAAPRVLLTGSSGAGKSAIAEAVAKAAGLPFIRLAASHLVATGWHGVGLEDALRDWPGWDAGRGVIQLDELCKVSLHSEEGNGWSKHYKQQAHFLPLLGREPVILDGGRTVESAGITVICTAAFSWCDWAGSGSPPTSQQLIEAGIIAELAGRLETRISVPAHTASTLAKLYRRELGQTQQAVQRFARSFGYRLRIAREVYSYVAEAAVARGANSREGRAWVEAACHAAISRALEDRRRPGVLVVSPDDVRLPPVPEAPKRGGGDTWDHASWP